MPKIRDIGSIAEKWGTVTPQRTDQYQQGVQNPKNSWAAGAKAAENTYKQAVTEAANAGRYGQGVSAAGDSTWQSGALNLGVGRFAAGVQAGQGKYQERFAKYASVISSTTLPPRGTKGSPANLQRVAVMAAALRAAKVGK